MTRTTEAARPTSALNWVTSNFIQLVAIAIIIIQASDIIISQPKTLGNKVAASYLRDMVSLGAPFAILITILMTVKVNYSRFTRGKVLADKYGSIVFFVSMLSMLIAQFTWGPTHPFWVAEYDLIYIHGTAAIEVLAGVATMMMLIRDVRPRSVAQGFVILVVILGLMVVSPVGDFFPPVVLDVANWFSMFPGGVGSSILTFGLYMGLLSLVVRVFLFKEKIRVGAE